jgi:hypothetical protein
MLTFRDFYTVRVGPFASFGYWTVNVGGCHAGGSAESKALEE